MAAKKDKTPKPSSRSRAHRGRASARPPASDDADKGGQTAQRPTGRGGQRQHERHQGPQRTVADLSSNLRVDVEYIRQANEGKHTHLLTDIHECAKPGCGIKGTITDLHPRKDVALMFVPTELTIELVKEDESWGDLTGKYLCFDTKNGLEVELKKVVAQALVEQKKARDIHEGMNIVNQRMNMRGRDGLMFFRTGIGSAAHNLRQSRTGVGQGEVKISSAAAARAVGRMRL